jgi:PD-(D/E)XK nuclease superfamily domain
VTVAGWVDRMPGRGRAVLSGRQLARRVCELGRELGLEVVEQYRAGRRLWGAGRTIDILLRSSETGKTLGVECKYQSTSGTTEEKIPATIQDIGAWPIDGIVVFAGAGFTENMKSFLVSTGKAVEFGDLEPWLRLYFGLPLDLQR